MKATLVTGATGFLGTHLVEHLKQMGTNGPLRLLCRGVSRWEQDPQVEVIRGDVTSSGDVLRAMEGVGQVYHLAGVVSRDPRDQWSLYRVHVEGTRNICEAACRQMARVLLVSSSGTIAVSKDPIVHDETSGYKHECVGEWPYYLSKIFAEKLALSYWKQQQLPVVIVNPSLLLGPGDNRNSSTRDVALFLRGQILAIPSGGLNFVDVRDVARGLVAAMRSGTAGERYLLGGPNWTFRQFIEELARISGRRAPKIQLSLGALLLGSKLLRPLYALAGRSYELDDVSIRMSVLFWYCDSSKARNQLDFKTRDPLETLRDTVEDLRRRSGPDFQPVQHGLKVERR